MRDTDVRAAVRRMLSAVHADDANTRIVEEMGLWSGAVRIDIAVINGELTGYELKSDQDTLERLPLQQKIYSRVFDKIDLVVGARHAEKAKSIIPPWWGITVASEHSGEVSLTCEQRGRLNPSPDAELVAKLLWKDEALAVLDAFGLAKGWRSKPAGQIHQRLAVELSYEDLSAQVRSVLKLRAGWLGKAVGDQRQMSVSTDLNPRLSAS